SEATAPLYRPGPTREGLYIDQAAHRIWIEGIEIAPPLSPAQYSLLELLYKQDGAICTRDEVVSAVWSEQEEAGGITDQAIDALVRRLRQRIKDSGSDHEYIETVRGHGFRLNQA
ncbi:MAG: winged helix-turn-helix transcriptional regulator, partial [Chloroflexia bacterium]|nr:winged helix-turn-helix transcriptional regulator [Chloroflexia bacterium]